MRNGKRKPLVPLQHVRPGELTRPQGRLGKIPTSAMMHCTPRNGCMFSCAALPPVAVVVPEPPPAVPGVVIALPAASDTVAGPALYISVTCDEPPLPRPRPPPCSIAAVAS